MNITRSIYLWYFLLGVLFLASDVLATPQILDSLRYKGKDRAVFYVMPLEAKITPAISARWFSRTSTACGRGYVAFWEIEDQFLILREIKACGPGFWDFTSVPLSAISSDWTNRVRATWFSGKFEIPIWHSRKGVGLPIFIAREFCIQQGRLMSTSLVFPILDSVRPFFFAVPLMFVVMVLGVLLLREMQKKAHNQPSDATR